MAEERRLLELAASVSDGREVDWEKAESEAEGEEQRELIRTLRTLSEISEAHRVWQEAGPAETATPESFPWTWGHLEVLEKVGEGSFGEVYRARDTRLDREVALKLIQRDSSGAVVEEGRLLARVRHPNVATVYGAEQREGRVGLWMEFLQGRTLSDLLREQGTFGAREATLIGVDLCRALAAVHSQGILHRDVKAQNVIREVGGRIVLTDFGIGRDLREEAPAERHLSGTPLYLAPEIFAGKEASVRSDLYSLGVLLYHLVTGSFPVQGSSLDELRRAHVQGEARLLRDQRPDLPAGFVQAVERVLDPDPARRPSSAGALEQALLVFLRTEEAAGEAHTFPRPSFRLRLTIAAAAAVVVLLVLGIWRTQRTEPLEGGRLALLVGDFENRTGNAALGSAARHLFTVALAQSPQLKVLSHDQVGEALKRMKKPAGTRLDIETARELCLRESAGILVTGEITQAEKGFSVTVSAVDTRSRTVRAMRTFSLARPEELVRRVDEAAAELRKELGEPRALIEQNRQPLERVTTGSLKALYRYAQALDLHADRKIELAIEALEAAVEADPEFAAAYSRLAIYQGGIGNYEDAFPAAEMAFRLRDRVSERERHKIAGTYHLDRLQYEEALREFERAVLLDPEDSDSYRQIALLHANLGEAQAGIEPARKASELPPPSVINHGVLILLLAQTQRPEEALRELAAARERFGNDIYLNWGEGVARVVKGDLPGAREAFEALTQGDPTYMSHGRILLAQTLMLQGKLREAAAQLERGRSLDARKGFDRNGAIRSFFLAKIHALLGDLDEAGRHLASIERLPDLPLHLKVLRNAALLSVEIGDPERAHRLLKRVESLRDRYPSALSRGAAAQIRGEIELAEGRPEEARESVREAEGEWDDPSTLRSLVRFWINQGDCERARELVDRMASARGRGVGDFFAPWVDLRTIHQELDQCPVR